MTLLGLVILLMGAVTAVVLAKRVRETGRKERLVRQLHRADDSIQQEHQRARRAMNNAAGQSWRNRFE